MLKKSFFLLFPLVQLVANPIENLEPMIQKLQEMLGLSKEESDMTCTSHTIHLPSGPISYTAITGKLDLYTYQKKIIGKMFFTAYLKDPEKPKGDKNKGSVERPVTFIFNGGPGGSCLSMHIGGLGPRRVLFPEEGQKSYPPYELIDNPQTLLEYSDLVMIDPIGTGYSRPEEAKFEPFLYGCDGDIAAFGEFIRMFCITFDRWNSPKYLMGASYGGIRGIGLAEHTMNVCGLQMQGLILLSPAIDYSTFIRERDHYLPDCLSIPTMAATAWYHGRGNQKLTLEETVEYARRFAAEEYAPFMLQQTRLSPFEKTAFYQKFADLIGLPVDTVEKHQARFGERTYTIEFFAKERQMIGGVDTRYKGFVSAIESEYIEDPSYQDIRPCFYPSFLHYLQSELDTTSPFPQYVSYNPFVARYWDFNTFDSDGAPNFMQRLRRTLVRAPNMQVFVALGYFDLRTPLGASEYSIDRLELPDSFRKNFQIEYYPAGHGFIFDLTSLKKFQNDMIRFYEKNN